MTQRNGFNKCLITNFSKKGFQNWTQRRHKKEVRNAYLRGITLIRWLAVSQRYYRGRISPGINQFGYYFLGGNHLNKCRSTEGIWGINLYMDQAIRMPFPPSQEAFWRFVERLVIVYDI